MRRRQIPGICLPLAVVTFVLITVILYYIATRRRPLLESSTRAALVGTWHGSSGNPADGAPFCWINENEILGGRDEGRRQRLVRKRFDGSEQALSLTVPTVGYTWSESPDGAKVQWVEFAAQSTSTGGTRQIDLEKASTLEGRPLVARQLAQRPIWSADSNSLFYMDDADRIGSPAKIDGGTLHRLDLRTGQVREFHLGGLPPPPGDARGAPMMRPMIHLRNGRIIILEYGQRANTPPATYYRCGVFDLNHPAKPLETWQLTLPSGSTSSMLVPSPDGEHILWQAYGPASVSPISRFLGRWLRAFRTRPGPTVQLCISDVHGQGMHQIGCYNSVGNGDKESGGMRYLMPRWSPDGRKIGFVFNGYLYTLPAR